MSDYAKELTSNEKYVSLKSKRLQIVEYQKIKQKMINRQHVLLENMETYKSIPRMEIANLKSLYSNNNQTIGKALFECLSLLIGDSEDVNTIKRTILDINLSLRIKQISLKDKKQEVIKAVEQKLNHNIFQQ